MDLVIRRSLESHNREEMLREIQQISASSGDLTPRSLVRLTELYSEGRVVLAFVDGVLAGWVITEPLTQNLDELGMAYVKPEYRGLPVFDGLSHEIIRPGKAYVMAGYNENMIKYVEREFGFRQVGLFRVIFESRGRFITKRLNPEARSAIKSRLKNKRPLFAFRAALARQS